MDIPPTNEAGLIEALYDHAKQTKLLPYESLEMSLSYMFPSFKDDIEEQLKKGYTREGSNIPTVYPPIDWLGHNRSFSFYLHTWEPITDFMTGFSIFGDPRYIDAALAYATSWIYEFQVPLFGKTSDEELDALVKPEMKAEWYDMAVGRRCYRMAYLLDYLIRQESTSKDELIIWWNAIQFHFKLLNREHFFRSHNNHGLYQATGHLAAARRFRKLSNMEEQVKIAEKRLAYVLEHSFGEEGFHKEHSPAYHYMLMSTLMNVQRCGLIDNPELKARMILIEAALPWMTKPNNYLVTFGDTDPRHLKSGETIAKLYKNLQLQHILSDGKVGKPALEGVGKFLADGYAFARISHKVKAGKSTAYLAQLAAFHSRVHKQADHLTFVWFDYGRDILTDAGRFAYAGKTIPGSELFEEGFWYSDPKRIYCESTRSHNCVVIDGKNYQRKRVKPFGSALIDAREENGMVVTDCEVWHFKTVKHRRRLVMKPGHFLVVLDWLYDRSGEQHEYVQRFLFDAPWYVAKEGEIVRAFHAGGKNVRGEEVEPLHLCAGTAFANAEIIPIIRGQEEPELLGWISDEPYRLIPACSMGVRAIADGPHSFCTIFTLSETLEIDKSKSRTNSSKTTGTVVWKDDFGTHHLKFIPIEDIVRFEIESV